jgi:hypothetical protein
MTQSTTLYATFENPERLVLMLEAMARGDDGEADRLRESCPRKTYSSVDIGFWQRAIVSFETAAVAYTDLTNLCGKLHMVQWTREILDTSTALATIVAEGALMDGIDLARGAGRPPASSAIAQRGEAIEEHVAENGQKLQAIVSDVERHWVRGLKTAWEAFEKFCRTRPGVEAKTLLTAWKLPSVGEIEALLKTHPNVKPDAAEVEEYFRLLCVLWDNRFEDFRSARE